MSYLIKLDQFEGPLDLLLHLIAKSKVQIEDISITEITEQYIETLNIMEQFDIEIASEFIVMAATLLHIKSCILVPKSKSELDEEEESDPKQELITRLLEYKKYKEASRHLQEREALFSGVFYKLPEEFYSEENNVEVFQPSLPESIDARLLSITLIKLLADKKAIGSGRIGPLIHEIKRDPKTVGQRISELKNLFKDHAKVSFFQILENDNSKVDIIVTFLALLELMKESYVILQQEHPFEDITIKRRVSNG